MESFAAVVRTLLARIRALKCCRSDNWPPSAGATAATSLYRVPKTRWGVGPADATPADAPAPDVPKPIETARVAAARRCRRRGLELAVYGLPVPRGLPAI